MRMKINKIFKRSVWTILGVFFILVFALTLVLGGFAKVYESWIDQYFNAKRSKLVIDEEIDPNQDTQYYKSDYAVKDENGKLVLTTDEDGVQHQVFDNVAMRKNSMEVAERVAEDGAVLLWNDKNALPLATGSKVTTFGCSSINWLPGGTGSGNVSIKILNFADALTSHGFEINKKAITAIKVLGAGRGFGQFYGESGNWLNNKFRYTVNELAWDTMKNSAYGPMDQLVGEYNEAAIFTVSRNGGENGDTNFFDNDQHIDNKYLHFTHDEISVLNGLAELKKKGVVKKIILLVNSASAIPLNPIKDIDIDACLWVGLGGSASVDAVCDLLSGKTNPSGRLNDSWAYEATSAPATENHDYFEFTQSDGVPPATGSGHAGWTANKHYLVYQEGIYVGYRYYETRYEDSVIGGRNANGTAGVKAGDGGWKYSSELAYTFGHGLSYTTFDYSEYKVKENKDSFDVSVKVTNTGNRDGKHTVQIYAQKPYTDYDKATGVEKAAVELVGFDKTRLLKPGEAQTMVVNVPKYELKTYDSYGKKTYILEKGDYYLATGKNAHAALNNILAAKGYTKANGMDDDGDKAFAYKITQKSDDFVTYSKSPYGDNKEITNLFDDVDPTLYKGTKDQGVKFLSRSDWQATYPTGAVLTCTDPDMVADMQYGREIPQDPNATAPVYGKETSEFGRLSLIQLRGLDYEDPMWDDLLNQMSFDEQVDMVKRGVYHMGGAKSIVAPEYDCSDGPGGIRIKHYNLEGVGSEQMAFPCGGLVASTFDTELVAEYANAFAMEIMHINYVGIYAPGANIHRSPYGGRNWEYYSEDGFVSGKMLFTVNKGLMNKGIVVFAKHFVLNDQEVLREGVTVWCNEQAFREIYLKAFEEGLANKACNALMSSYNRIGCTWAGNHKGLLTDLLRGEWAFNGVCVTDSPSSGNMAGTPSIYAYGIYAGQDVWMGSVIDNAFDDYKNNNTFLQALREATKRNLFVRVNSAALNGATTNARIVKLTPGWETALLTVQILTGIFACLCTGMSIAAWILYFTEKRKNGA